MLRLCFVVIFPICTLILIKFRELKKTRVFSLKFGRRLNILCFVPSWCRHYAELFVRCKSIFETAWYQLRASVVPKWCHNRAINDPAWCRKLSGTTPVQYWNRADSVTDWCWHHASVILISSWFGAGTTPDQTFFYATQMIRRGAGSVPALCRSGAVACAKSVPAW